MSRKSKPDPIVLEPMPLSPSPETKIRSSRHSYASTPPSESSQDADEYAAQTITPWDNDTSFLINDGSRSSTRSKPVKRSSTALIILLMTSAILPAVLGALFYLSLDLTAPDGQYLSNATYVRPVNETILGRGTILNTKISPLLVSSISSTLIGEIGVLITTLMAYHLAHKWICLSRTSPDSLPTPYQYFLVVNTITNAGIMAFFRTLHYVMFRRTASPNKPKRFLNSSNARAVLSPILILTTLGLCFVLCFSLAIKVLDIVLHDQITSTNMLVNVTTSLNASAIILPQCQDAYNGGCGVLSRTDIASVGGANLSTNFRVYEYQDEKHGNVAYLGPAEPDNSLIADGHTFAAASQCGVFRPLCNVENETTQSCGPAPLDLPNQLFDPPNVDFDVSGLRTKAQLMTTSWANMSGYSTLSEGTDANPFTSVGWMCFNDYSNIQFSNDNTSYPTPFVDWWMIGPGIGNKPYPLCFIFTCNTTVYDGSYAYSNGNMSLQTQSLSLSNASATLSMGGPLMYLGNPPQTSYYQYGSPFIEEQFQADITTAGNMYGNSTTDFSNALAQSLSNRLAGWSAGAVEFRPKEALMTVPVLATRIPLVTAYAFAALHFLYALAIVILGLSCLVLPSAYHPSDKITSQAMHEQAGSEPKTELVSDLKVAHLRFADAATVVHELVLARSRPSRPSSLDRGSQTPAAVGPRLQQMSSVGSGNLKDAEGGEADVRIGLQKDHDGALRLRLS